MSIIPPPGLTTRQVRAANAGYVSVSRQQPIAHDVGKLTTQNSLNQRTVFWSPKQSAISDIVVSFPGSFYEDVTAVETDWPQGYTVTAAIEYPVGTFTPLYTGGSRTLTVTPGRRHYRFDPCPIDIPAGTRFWVKAFAQWSVGSFPLCQQQGVLLLSPGGGEWMNSGTGLSDQTLTTTTFSSSPSGQGGFATMCVRGKLRNPTAVVGILGDSISVGFGDFGDTSTGARHMEKALQGLIPSISIPRGFDGLGSTLYGGRHECRDGFLRDQDTGQLAITDLILSMGRNDVTTAANLTAMQNIYLPHIDRFLSWGLRLWMITVTPYSASPVDFWTTTNQTPDVSEPVRQAWNSYLRANYRSLGVRGLFDWAHVMDPTDSGKWSWDAGLAANDYRHDALGVPTMAGRAVSSATFGNNLLSNSGGANYPISSTFPCAVVRYYGDKGTSDAVINASSNASGLVNSYTVVSGGDYDYPPLITPPGRWTNDGLHPSQRGYALLLGNAGIYPGLFLL